MVHKSIECPLGGQCESVKDNGVHVCAWYIKIAGTTPEGKEVDESKCAMAWLPTLMIEMSQTNRGQTAALESFRNESTNNQKEFNSILDTASKMQQLGRGGSV